MQKNLNIEKIIFKVVQIMFLAMHITNQKLRFDIFTVGHLLNIFMEHDLQVSSIRYVFTLFTCSLLKYDLVHDISRSE